MSEISMTRDRIVRANYDRPRNFLVDNITKLDTGFLIDHPVNIHVGLNLTFYIKNTIDEKLDEAS